VCPDSDDEVTFTAAGGLTVVSGDLISTADYRFLDGATIEAVFGGTTDRRRVGFDRGGRLVMAGPVRRAGPEVQAGAAPEALGR
jgi:hypothetical protein